MSLIVPRLRMFAGPNGSGKSTIKSLLPADLLGIYINPDEIQLQLQSPDGLGFDSYWVLVFFSFYPQYSVRLQVLKEVQHCCLFF